MPPRTLKQIFYENLTVYPEDRVPDNYRSLGKDVDELVKCIIVIPDPLIMRAQSYLSRITASPATALNSLALPIDDTINFQTEADVFRASCLELLYPVNKALTEGLGKGERVFCGGERKMNTSRVDLRWSYQANENAGSRVFLRFWNSKIPELFTNGSFGLQIQRVVKSSVNCMRR
ncbi:hypothetical protein TESG_05285 [Trichophyton tonsurans CBS 112818]|uniref:Uncharacterized protein n=1 Tax=Trichophyton tonsurans (strain CBS 112818) TaxID=647933 RepID=F2S346_TRIT1|nr:hypothetical protein TESG_05285 [Trichophyton tonsurans CBS 112818]